MHNAGNATSLCVCVSETLYYLCVTVIRHLVGSAPHGNQLAGIRKVRKLKSKEWVDGSMTSPAPDILQHRRILRHDHHHHQQQQQPYSSSSSSSSVTDNSKSKRHPPHGMSVKRFVVYAILCASLIFILVQLVIYISFANHTKVS